MLTAFAIRTCAYLAMRGATAAGDAVYDSQLSPLGDLLKATARSGLFLTVAIDEAQGEPSDKNLLNGISRMFLTIEAAVAKEASFAGREDAEPTSTIVTPATDMGLEFAIDLLVRQALRALQTNEPWASLFADFVPRIEKMTLVRGGDSGGTRYASRQIVLECMPAGDPAYGEPLEEGSVWLVFLAALRAIDAQDPTLGGYPAFAAAIEAEIHGGSDREDWARVAAYLGLGLRGVVPLGITPAELLIADDETMLDPDEPLVDVEAVDLLGHTVDEDFVDQTTTETDQEGTDP